MQRNEYNIAIFKSLREEINLRISTHYRTLIFKFVGMGAIFSVLFAQEILAIPFVAAAAYGFLLDILMLENLGWIRSCGGFIKDKVEATDKVFQPQEKPPEIIKWEHYVHEERWNCFSARGYFLGVWLPGPLLMPGFIAFALSENTKTGHVAVGWYAFIIALAAAAYTMHLIRKRLGSDDKDSFWQFVRRDILMIKLPKQAG